MCVCVCVCVCGAGSSVAIATDYGLGTNQPPVNLVPVTFPRVKSGRGVLLTTHHLLVPRSWKSRAIPLPNLWAKPGL
jgi:tetrahydromethanopterin S-methyltransferase subunit C